MGTEHSCSGLPSPGVPVRAWMSCPRHLGVKAGDERPLGLENRAQSAVTSQTWCPGVVVIAFLFAQWEIPARVVLHLIQCAGGS